MVGSSLAILHDRGTRTRKRVNVSSVFGNGHGATPKIPAPRSCPASESGVETTGAAHVGGSSEGAESSRVQLVLPACNTRAGKLPLQPASWLGNSEPTAVTWPSSDGPLPGTNSTVQVITPLPDGW